MVQIQERADGTRRVSITFDENVEAERSRTKPQHAKDCDINVIMKRYKKTGVLGNPLESRQGVYGDFSSGEDFTSAMMKITKVKNYFLELPAEIRSKFNNDPSLFVDFVNDPANDLESIKMGFKEASKAVKETDAERIEKSKQRVPGDEPAA